MADDCNFHLAVDVDVDVIFHFYFQSFDDELVKCAYTLDMI